MSEPAKNRHAQGSPVPGTSVQSGSVPGGPAKPGQSARQRQQPVRVRVSRASEKDRRIIMPIASELILRNLTSATLCLDHQLRIQFINQSAESLLEVSEGRSLGQPLASVLSEAGELQSLLFDALQTNQAYTRRKDTLRLAQGHTVTVDYTISIFNEDERPLLLLEIIPQDRYLRIDREEGHRQHEQTTRMMIRGLAHEVKNPLGGIRGAAQLLARELPAPELTEYTNIIIEETDRLAALVDRLLGPTTQPRHEPGNIHEIIERAARLIETETSIAIQRDYDPSIPELMLDADMVQQALLNIVRNASQALADTPHAAIQLVTRTERQFTIGTKRHRVVVRIDVTDNGPGVPPELADQLFYPMISGRAEGSGLGLSIAQSIIMRHEGIIEFHSRPGQTVFTVIMPLTTPTDDDAASTGGPE